jgi:hypothetical protein
MLTMIEALGLKLSCSFAEVNKAEREILEVSVAVQGVSCENFVVLR